MYKMRHNYDVVYTLTTCNKKGHMVCVMYTPQDSVNNTLYSWVYSYTISFGVQYTPVLVVSVKYTPNIVGCALTP